MSTQTPGSGGRDRDGGDRSGELRASIGHLESEARARAEELSAPFRERLEQPVQKVTVLTRRTMALFPVRVWRHFLAQNGFLLSAGMSYQALFAVFAAVYVGFSVAGIWFSGQQAAVDALVTLVNTYVPGLIGDDGPITPEGLTAAVEESTSFLGWTGAIALGGLIWTAIGWVTYSRTAVRGMFGLAKDTRAYVLLKARDLLAALIFGVVLMFGASLTVASTAAISWMLGLLGLGGDSLLSQLVGGAAGLVLVFVIDAGALIMMFRFLSGAELSWRQLASGSLLGGLALVVLQVAGSTLVGSASRNPLLATFTVFIGLLLWFRLTSIVTLVAAAWIAVRAADRDESLRRVTAEQAERERREEERRALLIAARVELREARKEAASARWYARWGAERRVRAAEQALAGAQAQATDETVPRSRGGWTF